MTDPLRRCANPKCGKEFRPNHRGRPKEYCGKRCRDAAAYRRRQDQPSSATPPALPRRYSDAVRQISVATVDVMDDLVRVAHDDDCSERFVERMLELRREMSLDLDDLTAALVGLARDHGWTLARIAPYLDMDPSTVSRNYPADAVVRRMRQRGRRLRESGGNGNGHGNSNGNSSASRPNRQDGPAPPALAWGVADMSPLACALSALQRTSGNPLRVLGERAGVSASYVSRVLSGERRPSWPVTEALVEACAGDPADILPLWEDARGQPVVSGMTAADFQATLRALHMAAGEPDPDDVRAAAHGLLSREDIRDLLYGWELPDWGRVDRFVHTLGARPDDYRALWRAAHGAHRPPFAPAVTFGPSAAAFG